MSTLLTVDIGNTNVTLGLYEQAELSAWCKLPLQSLRLADWDVGNVRPDAAVAASVNPPLDAAVRKAVKRRFGLKLRFLRKHLPVNAPDGTAYPDHIGADRLANATAAHRLSGGAAVVVDLGSALTLDVADATGAFIGGAIAPGLRMAAGALHTFTASLPDVDLEEPPDGVAVRSTGMSPILPVIRYAAACPGATAVPPAAGSGRASSPTARFPTPSACATRWKRSWKSAPAPIMPTSSATFTAPRAAWSSCRSRKSTSDPAPATRPTSS
jgi:pantothenate kinase type III